jgi:hypothetical protein
MVFCVVRTAHVVKREMVDLGVKYQVSNRWQHFFWFHCPINVLIAISHCCRT